VAPAFEASVVTIPLRQRKGILAEVGRGDVLSYRGVKSSRNGGGWIVDQFTQLVVDDLR
jgi:hypothetical protein